MKIKKRILSLALAGTMALGLMPGMNTTALAADGDSTYTLTIPSALTVANSGWNATSGISATGTLASGKKLTVTAASTNNWALKSGDNTVGYNLATATGTYSSSATPASWEFKKLSNTATTMPMGIIVDDYSTKPAGTYQDTVTFTAKVESASTTLNNTIKAWTAGSYAVPAGGLTYSDAITVSGDVTLVLTDGETLTLNKGISLASGAMLTIQGNGTMNVNGTNGADNNTRVFEASADSGTEAISGSGTVVLTSGTLTATGGKGGNVDDYMPECKGGHGAAGISCTLIVNGGTVTATGGNGGSLTNGYGPLGVAGNGGAGISGALTVNGGTLTATGGDGGAKSNGPGTEAGTNGRGISSTWTAGTGITFSDSADGTSWTTNNGTSSTQKYVKAE